jgi:transcription initiation factor TFIIIB Brf1 subunit/transcription initiation factor TFIIB
MTCLYCGSFEIVTDSHGNFICLNCGEINSKNQNNGKKTTIQSSYSNK